jgi:hypothetical protein
MCRPSTDYYSQTAGGSGNYSQDGLIPQSNGKNFYTAKNFEMPLNNKFMEDNYGVDYATAFGGKKGKKKTATKKTTGKKSSKKAKPSTKKTVGRKRRTQKGGQESSGATPMAQRFYDPNDPVDSYPANSGNGIISAYGPIEVGNVGVGMLAPYTASNCASANPNTDMQTGGKKKKRAKKSEVKKEEPKKKSILNSVKNFGSKVVEKSKTLIKKTSNAVSSLGKSKKSTNEKKVTKKRTGKKKSQKGGQESSGATPMPLRFYDPNAHLDNFASDSGNGMASAYGPIEVGNVGVGMLAPYTSSTCPDANPSTDMKTGGRRRNKKMGGGPIPYIPNEPVLFVQKTADKAIGEFTSFMSKLDQDYLKSVDYIKSIKIGDQRLIQGGKSKSSKKKSTATKKKSTAKKSKTTKKAKGKKSHKGGSTGSDFALTLNSRGPANAPDDYWGVPGETWFRQFNKTGDYIPNSQLPYAATPLLAGRNDSGVVTGYDESILAYPSV